MQLIVRAFAVVMSRVMGASGAESLNVAASIFMGQTEAPLTIRPFLPRMTRSELMTVMTSGMAHISGSIMVAYIAFGIEARHLLTAVIMTAPGTIMMAKLFEPETEMPETYGKVKLDMPKQDVNLLDAAARGTSEGLHLMLNVIAMLVSFVALVALLNGGFGAIHRYVAWFPANLQTVLGWIFRPIAWAMGVPWHDSGVDRQPARHPHGAERVHRLRAARAAEGAAGPALVHDRVVRAGGLRQLQLGRHPARRHRRARPRAQARPRAAGPPRHAGRHARQLPLRHDRGHPAVTASGTAAWAAMADEAAAALREHLGGRTPSVAIVLGSGLGQFAERLTDAVRVPYHRIPHFPSPTVIGHSGELVAGTLAGRSVLVQSGRFHMYEGHPPALTALPVRVFARLGVETLVLTNAAGGIRRSSARARSCSSPTRST